MGENSLERAGWRVGELFSAGSTSITEHSSSVCSCFWSSFSILSASAIYDATRLEVDLKTVQEALRYHDPYEVHAAMSRARDRVKRSSEMIKVIQECYNCIETAVVQGVRWVARTSPTNWSIEHPLCGMDLMIILSLWLYRLEHDDEPASEEEMAMYNKIRKLFEKDLDQQYISQLGTIVARLWGSMLDEVVVWG